jgi:hypothetical protein
MVLVRLGIAGGIVAGPRLGVCCGGYEGHADGQKTGDDQTSGHAGHDPARPKA